MCVMRKLGVKYPYIVGVCVCYVCVVCVCVCAHECECVCYALLCVLIGMFFWLSIIGNKSCSRVLVVLSDPLLSVANCTPGSWWLFFWPALI